MTYKVYVRDDPARSCVFVYVMQVLDEHTRLALHHVNGATQWDPVAIGAESPYTFAFDYEIAPLLAKSLHDLYEGYDDTQRLRQDYNHERNRVDKMLDALITLAQETQAIRRAIG